MNEYYFRISGTVIIKADSLEEAQEDLRDFAESQFEGCVYNTEPIAVDEQGEN